MASKKTTTKKAEPTKERKARTGTKMEKALAIVKANPNLPRKTIIGKFMSDVKLTKAGASTYWALIQAKLKDK
jgi:hypothetical protein